MRRNELLNKLELNNLTIDEAKELRDILQEELKEAIEKENTPKIVAIFSILLLLAFILSKE